MGSFFFAIKTQIIVERRYDIFKETGGVEYRPMINELRKRTHLPKWICEKVYDAEASILTDLGLIN